MSALRVGVSIRETPSPPQGREKGTELISPDPGRPFQFSKPQMPHLYERVRNKGPSRSQNPDFPFLLHTLKYLFFQKGLLLEELPSGWDMQFGGGCCYEGHGQELNSTSTKGQDTECCHFRIPCGSDVLVVSLHQAHQVLFKTYHWHNYSVPYAKEVRLFIQSLGNWEMDCPNSPTQSSIFIFA